MKCEYAQLFLDDYADRTLSDAQSKLIEDHVNQCHKCRSELDEIVEFKKQLSFELFIFSPSVLEDLLCHFPNKLVHFLPLSYQIRSLVVTFPINWVICCHFYIKPSH